MPRTLSPYGQDLILRLLDKDPQRRLGGGQGGFEEIKQHSLFQVQCFTCVIFVCDLQIIF